jgi:hypothetical protein
VPASSWGKNYTKFSAHCLPPQSVHYVNTCRGSIGTREILSSCRSLQIEATAQSVPFFPLLRAKPAIVPNWSRYHFLPQPSDSFSNHPTTRRGVIWSIDSIFEENMNKCISLYCLCFIFLSYLISICINGQTAFRSSLLFWKISCSSF